MKRLLALGAALLALPAGALAQSSYGYTPYRAPTYTAPSYTSPTYAAPRTTRSYDWQSGNSYSTTTQPDGSSRTRGFNTQTGSMWNSQTSASGNSRGTDASGNVWSYNPRSGSYTSSDGTVCVGKGAARICN